MAPAQRGVLRHLSVGGHEVVFRTEAKLDTVDRQVNCIRAPLSEGAVNTVCSVPSSPAGCIQDVKGFNKDPGKIKASGSSGRSHSPRTWGTRAPSPGERMTVAVTVMTVLRGSV